MFKKLLLSLIVLSFAFSAFPRQASRLPKAQWEEEITMMVVPRDPTVVQLAQDISRRYAVMLVCYQLTPEGPVLHAWNGDQWIDVENEDYTNGTFFTTPPDRAVVVEGQPDVAPSMLITNQTWCESISRVASVETPVLIHLLGRYFDFPYSHWVQFADRYNYTVEEINPGLVNIYWWHYPANEVAAAFKARNPDRDMDKWFPAEPEIPEPEMIEIPEAGPPDLPPEEPAAAEEMLEEMASMPSEDPEKNVSSRCGAAGRTDQRETAGSCRRICISNRNRDPQSARTR
jgi:hypothetical protein